MRNHPLSRRIVRAVTLAVAALLGLATFVRPPAASARPAAHPLGNFTINRYSRIEVSAGRIQVHYVLDMAEIPAFQEMQVIDQDRNGQVSDAERDAYLSRQVEQLRGHLHLTLNSSPATLNLVAQGLTFPPGQGGLNILRLTALFEALPVGPSSKSELRLDYQDDNYADRIGWKEIVIRAGEGITLVGSSVPDHDQSDELRNYPQDMLASPLNVSAAHASFSLSGRASSDAPVAASAAGSIQKRAQDGFAALITTKELSLPIILLSLVAAAFWGALHAFTPGHGKTIVGAYLVGSRGTAKHALFLGLTTTLTHTAGVFALGLVTLFASRYILPDKLYPWLEFISGLLVAVIGVNLFVTRLHAAHWREADQAHNHSHDHEHDHEHDHAHHSHSHLPAGKAGSPVTWRGLLALGVSGGLLPCPSALIVMLSAIALDRIGYGMVLVLAFSVGLAGVLTATGLLFLYARRWFERFNINGPILKLVPAGSALVIAVAGLGIAIGALMRSGLLG